jgi:hypothetical protein
MRPAGWHPDPTGRFAFRYHDGARWTETISDPAGRVGQDTLPLPPGLGLPAGPVWAPGGAPWGGPPPGVPSPGYRPPAGSQQVSGQAGRAPGLALLAFGAGALLIVASLFVLPWVDGEKGHFLDVRKGLDRADKAGASIDVILLLYARLGAFAVAVILALIVLRAIYGGSRLSWPVRLAFVPAGAVLGAAVYLLGSSSTPATATVTTPGAPGGVGASHVESEFGVVFMAVVGVTTLIVFASSFVPAQAMAVLFGGCAAIWHVVAVNKLSDLGAHVQFGAWVAVGGFVALAAAGLTARRRRSGPWGQPAHQ